MAFAGIPPLDLQTEHLDRDQYPSVRMLLVVALIACSGLTLSWAMGRDASPSSVAVQQKEAQQPAAVDRTLIARAFPRRP
jgi:hypothetical protein